MLPSKNSTEPKKSRGGGLERSTQNNDEGKVNRRGRASWHDRATRKMQDMLFGIALGGFAVVAAVVCCVLIAVTSYTRKGASEATKDPAAHDTLCFMLGAATLFVAGALCKLALEAGRELNRVMIVAQNSPAVTLALHVAEDKPTFDVASWCNMTTASTRFDRSAKNAAKGYHALGKKGTLGGLSEHHRSAPADAGWEARAASLKYDVTRNGEVVVRDTGSCTCIPCVSACDYVAGLQREAGYRQKGASARGREEKRTSIGIAAQLVEKRIPSYAATVESVRFRTHVVTETNSLSRSSRYPAC